MYTATVDLNDWTTEYRELSSGANDHGIPNLPRARLALWCYMCSFFQGDRLYYDPGAEYAMKEGIKNSWTKSHDVVYSLYRNHEIRHCFNWGDYTALSYVWGDATDRQDILLDGHRFSVTRSLYNVLSHLRDAFEVDKRELQIWADAVCINQDDQEERAREVKKMGVIYSQCFSVTAWLGDPTPAIACELPSVRNFLDSMSIADIRVPDGYESGFELVMDLIRRLSAAHSLEVVSSGLTLSPFWERLWTIQELALAPTILFHYGKEAFTTGDVWKLCIVSVRLLRILNGEERDSNDRIEFGMGRVLSRLRRLVPFDDYDCLGKTKLFTADYVKFARTSKSKDPRDKVFGLLALLPDSIAERIEPNYDKSISMQDTYVMFFKSCYEAAGNLDFLARVIMPPFVTPNLPSWFWAEFHLLAEREISESRAAIPASNYDWKLALARVLMQDSFFEFSESPSVLDLRWPNPVTPDSFKDKPHYHSSDYDRQFTKHVSASALKLAFLHFLHGNEDFAIGGKALRDYFTSSTDTDCADPAEDQNLVRELYTTAAGSRLWTTENGLLGTAPYYARLGNKIAGALREPALLSIHPGIGEILVFLGLVQYFPDRPIYGLRARGFNPGESPSDALTDILSTYFEALKKQQPHGPYPTAGYPYGTMLVFELSKMLDGNIVQFLGSFNLPPHIKERKQILDWTAGLLHISYFCGIITERRSEGMVDELRELPQSEQVIKLLAESDQGRCGDPALTRELLKT
ncbi:MAG: hypothetical protein Q9192_005207 [Flavoplaca navasiana]